MRLWSCCAQQNEGAARMMECTSVFLSGMHVSQPGRWALFASSL